MNKIQKIRLILRALLVCSIFVPLSITAHAQTVRITVEASEDGEGCTGADIQNALNTALEDTDKNYVIDVPAGKYTLSAGLHIYSNTTLNLSGVTFKRGTNFGKGAMILVGNPRKEEGKSTSAGGGYTKGGYSRGEKIRINGGVFDAGTRTDANSLCTFSHVSDITFQGTTFRYLPKSKNNAHLMEFGASKNVKLLKCCFIGNQKVGEAVQIESAVKGVASSDLMGKEDGTKTKNVTISGCRFTDFQYAIGTNHGCSKDIYTGFVISKNTFTKITKYAICTYNYRGVKIQNNRLKQSGASFDARILKLGTKDTYKKSGNK